MHYKAIFGLEVEQTGEKNSSQNPRYPRSLQGQMTNRPENSDRRENRRPQGNRQCEQHRNRGQGHLQRRRSETGPGFDQELYGDRRKNKGGAGPPKTGSEKPGDHVFAQVRCQEDKRHSRAYYSIARNNARSVVLGSSLSLGAFNIRPATSPNDLSGNKNSFVIENPMEV